MVSVPSIVITVGDVQSLLIPTRIEATTFVVVYLIDPNYTVTATDLRDFRANVLEKDDVFQPDFCLNVVFYGPQARDGFKLPDGAKRELETCNTKSVTMVNEVPSVNVGPGPYVSMGGKPWQPWRIYRDFNATLMCGFKPLLKNPLRPLDGVRITVKDNIDIKGHNTSLCNRAWQELYPPKTKNAHCVQVLIDAGAIIVGKAKPMAMIMREEPLECVEFTAPFNPRGDGYQISSGSSHGSTAGIASPFPDDTATNGSGRKPAHYSGCFSIRPSSGIMNTDGVIGQFPKFDMPVFFGRDISTFSRFISVWYGDSPMLRNLLDIQPLIFKILYPLGLSSHKGLEKALGVKRIEVSLADAWSSDCPHGAENKDLAEYLKLAGSYTYYKEAYDALQPFVEEYREKYGKAPFIHRAMLWQWSVARNITEKDPEFYWNRVETYRKWLQSRIFDTDSEDTITVMALPIMDGKPSYRDAELPPYYILSGYSPLNMSPIMGAPEVTAIAIQVGEIHYYSIVTQRDEPLPTAISLIGAPGTDLILVDLVEKAMRAAGIPTKVQIGRFMYGSPNMESGISR
ncbi:amidase [Podospora fimiseda]|uniref:Amidase n=1 Tax=Podospora fimiseda TaxID=252190 RepID=A0AAN7H3Y7_9PEZI|nr:amidase [Podospora fimiseda]